MSNNSEDSEKKAEKEEKEAEIKRLKELWHYIAKTLNNFSYIAAGSISLSITFLGYILSMGTSAKNVLNTSFVFNIPIIWFLFASWVFLTITIILGTLINQWIGLSLYQKRREQKNDADYWYKRVNWTRVWTLVSFFIGIFLLVFFVSFLVNSLINI